MTLIYHQDLLETSTPQYIFHYSFVVWTNTGLSEKFAKVWNEITSDRGGATQRGGATEILIAPNSLKFLPAVKFDILIKYVTNSSKLGLSIMTIFILINLSTNLSINLNY